MPSTPVFSSFNAGELSPKMDARSDVEKYAMGCKILENFINLPQGGVQRRAGTEYIANVKYNDKNTRLIPFNFSNESAVVIEIGDFYMRFFKDGEPVVSAPNVPYEIKTPWPEGKIDLLRFKQSADVVYISHPDYFPRKLSRYDILNWVLEKIDFTYQAFKDENTDDNNIMSFSNITSSTLTMTSSKPTFYTGMVGCYWLVRHPRIDNEISKKFTNTGLPIYSSSIKVKGDWTFVTHGTWKGEVVIERSFDNGTTWHNYRNYTAQNDTNIDATGTEELDGVLYRIGRIDALANEGNVQCYFNVQDYFTDGILQITDVVSDTKVNCDIIVPIGDTIPTGVWAEGAWSTYSGFPTCLAFFEERLCWAGTKLQPQTIWMSKSADYENLTTGELDDDALIYTISSGEVDAIKWMYPQNALLIGTTGNEWKLGATKINEALTPVNVSCKIQSNNGSADIEPLFIDNSILYAQNHAKIIREMAYSYNDEKYMSVDITITSDHILGRDGIKCMGYQRNPFSIAWFVRKDGQLAGLTYNREQKIIAWHRHVTDGQIKSVAVINGEYEDEVWIIAERYLPNGGTVKYIEKLSEFNFGDIEDAKFTDSHLSDGKLGLDMAGIIYNLDHLEGKLVSVFCDGSYKGDHTVNNGKIDFNHSGYSKITVGLPFTSTLETMRIEGQIANGGSQGRIKRIDEVVVRFLDTIGGKIINTEGQENLIKFRNTVDPMNNQVKMFFGDKKIKFGGGYSNAMTVKVIQDIPLPMTVLMLSPRISVNG